MIRPPGGPPTIELDPVAGGAVDQLQGVARGERSVVMIGKLWRLRAAPWPTATSQVCLLTERFVGSAWKTLRVLDATGVETTP